MPFVTVLFNDLIGSSHIVQTHIRQFFPEANEVQFARNSTFGGASFKLDYLTKPSFFEDFGFITKVKMADRVKPEDELFVVAYPYFNVNGNLRIIPSLPLPPSEKSKEKCQEWFQVCCLSTAWLLLFIPDLWHYTEMLVVEELYKEAVIDTPRKMIIFNGELDRIRSGCILSTVV